MRPYKRRERSQAGRAEAARSAFEHKRLVVKRYRRLGLEWCMLIGALLGIIGGGLQMKGWENPLRGWAITTVVFSGILGAVGYLFYDIVFGSQIRAALEASGVDGDFAGSGGDAGGEGGDGGGD